MGGRGGWLGTAERVWQGPSPPNPPPARPPEHLKDQFAAEAATLWLSFLREKFLIVPLSGWGFCVPRYWRTEEDVSNHLDNPGQHRPT